MRRNFNERSSFGVSALVTVLSTATLWSCKGADAPIIPCGTGTYLADDGTCKVIEAPPEGCQPGYMFDPAQAACVQLDPCKGVTCQMPPGAVAVEAKAQGAACVCAPTQCQAPAYELQSGYCVAIVQCNPGYIQEGNVCVPNENVSCYELPQSPLCLPPRCDDPNYGSGTAQDGTDLRAEGKCLEDPAPPAESCVTNCHNGIEDPHPWYGGNDLTCTGCHGGNAAGNTRETAHVGLPASWQQNSPQFGRPNLRYYWNYNTLFGVENFDGGLEWLRFRNPSDLRVADQSCGKNSSCHDTKVENVRRGAMAVEMGLTGIANMRSGVRRSVVRDGDAIYKWDNTEGMAMGWGTLNAVTYNSEYTGSVQRISGFTIENREYNGAYTQVDILAEVWDKQCGDCHLGNAGANNRYADFRSSGCASCHMPYALDGRSRSLDQMIKKDEPTYPAAYAQIANFNANDLQNLNGAWLGPERAHPVRHQLTRQMASQRCGTCHVGSNRTDWQYRGYQIDPNRTAFTALNGGFLNANQVQFTDEVDNDANPFARYHGQAQNQVLKFIDWDNNGLDDIPADIHFQAGLECMDCHTTGEMHNELKFAKVKKVEDWTDTAQVDDMSGALWSHMDQATEVECVNCHGNLEYRALSFAADNRNPVKNLLVCPEPGEVIPDYTTPAECQTLGAGRWIKGKFSGRWHYVAQTYDTVSNGGTGTGGGVVRPPNSTRSGQPVYSENASIFHGRFNGPDLTDGAGPCPNGDVNNCFKDQLNNANVVTQGFSHLGKAARSANDQHEGGLECYACHSTWSNNCFGCHLRLADTNGAITLRDYARSTGELTWGAITEADFTYIAPLEMQYGINSEGKISQFLPETKMAVAHTDVNNNQYFGTQVIVNADANIQYNVYRDRAGYGLRQYNTEVVGLPLNSDGPLFEQFAQMDNNAGQGEQQMMPHSVQRSHPMMDCENCHMNVNQNNTDAVLARYMANANGFGNISAYLAVLANTGITRNNSNQAVIVDAAAGFRFDANIDPTAFNVNQQSDWCVLYDGNNNGFPLCYNNHPIKEGVYGLRFDPQYARAYPNMAHMAGPLNDRLLGKMVNDVIVANENVVYKGLR
ncbi:MAG: hypothetical protein H6730_31255 [Deltaproteobacteria bacterium]|nr:hypothetical protein [Deltaproteobacteria bacterium]